MAITKTSIAACDSALTKTPPVALTLGVPVVAADAPSYRELVGDGAAGWLFRPGDAASLAAIHGAGMRGLVYTVNDPAEARRLDALGIDGIVTDAVDRFSPGVGVAD